MKSGNVQATKFMSYSHLHIIFVPDVNFCQTPPVALVTMFCKHWSTKIVPRLEINIEVVDTGSIHMVPESQAVRLISGCRKSRTDQLGLVAIASSRSFKVGILSIWKKSSCHLNIHITAEKFSLNLCNNVTEISKIKS